jgi:polyhydroxybutyrate depolymerase
MKDSRIPYEGGLNIKKDGSFESFEDSKELWKKINECSNSINSENNLVIHESSPDCKDGVKSEFYSVKNSGHVWPGSVLELVKNIKNQSFPATDVIWNFFRS